ncbi:MAG: hypothetical protein JNM07_13055 [Phycisphaerae bacterium]|nr:hypothetical protein [Phycisphaerae bacterium]
MSRAPEAPVPEQALYFVGQKKASDWWVLADPAWERAHAHITFCHYCGRYFPPRPATGLDIALKQLQKYQVAETAYRSSIPVLSVAFFEHIRAYAPGCITGACRWGDGRPIMTHLTWHLPPVVTIRGGPRSGLAYCLHCRRTQYRPRYSRFCDDQYVLAAHVPDTQRVYMTDSGEPALWGWMVRTIPWEKFSNVMYYPLAIRETPLDGYPADLELERKRPDPAAIPPPPLPPPRSLTPNADCYTRFLALRRASGTSVDPFLTEEVVRNMLAALPADQTQGMLELPDSTFWWCIKRFASYHIDKINKESAEPYG